jgi:hypothetical protein
MLVNLEVYKAYRFEKFIYGSHFGGAIAINGPVDCLFSIMLPDDAHAQWRAAKVVRIRASNSLASRQFANRMQVPESSCLSVFSIYIPFAFRR